MKRWGSRRTFSALIALGAAGALALALPASAAATVTINPTGTLQGAGSAVTVTGTVTCSFANIGQITGPINETADLTVNLSQRSGRSVASGTGSDTNTAGPNSVACDGTAHNWSVSVLASEATRFKSGSASAQATYTACTVLNGQLLCEQGQAQRTILVG